MPNIVNKWNVMLSTITIIISLSLFTLPVHNYNYYLMAIYVVVNCMRAIFPKRDVECVCIHDHALSSIMLGRTIATIAEISFIILLINYYKNKSHINIDRLTNLILCIIIIAEICSWMGYNTIEESGWMVSFLLFITITIQLLKKNPGNNHYRLQFVLYTCFVLFLATVDIPMYYKRFKNHKKKYLSVSEGLKNIYRCKNVTNDYQVWKDEIPWQSGYFIFGSLFSIYIYRQII